MNLKEYYKHLLSEEIKKSTPQEAAAMRWDLGLPPKSTKENLGGTENPILRGNDWNVHSMAVVLRTLAAERDGRESLFTSKHRSMNKKGPAAAKAFTGTRNLLLHGTSQNPDERGLDMDAVSSPAIIQRNPPTEAEKLKHETISNHSAFLDARHAVKHIFDADLRPEHIEGLDINDSDFVKNVVDKVAFVKKIRNPLDPVTKFVHSANLAAIKSGILPSRP